MPDQEQPPFYWFHGASVAELQRRLALAVDPRLEVRIDGEDRMTLEVVSKGDLTIALTPINESHTCPPVCP